MAKPEHSRRIWVWALMTLAVLIPTYLVRFSLGPIPTTLWEVVLWIVGLAAIIRGQLRIETYTRDRFRWPLLLIVIGAVIAVSISPDHRVALGQFKAIFVDGLLWYGLLRSTAGDQSISHQIMTGAWIGGSVVGLEAISEWLRHQTTVDGRVIGLYHADPNASPNYLALFLAPLGAAALVTAWQAWSDRQLTRSLWTLLAGLLLASGVLVSGSRGGLLALAGGLVTAVTIGAISRWPRWRAVILGGAMLFVIGTALIVGPAFIPNLAAEQSAGGRLVSSNNIRWEIWRTTFETIIPHTSLLGLGLGNYQTVFGRLTAHRINFPEYVTPYALHPHNFFLASYLFLGLTGLVGWLWLLSLIVRELRGRAATQLTLVAAGTTWLMHGLVDTPFYKNDLAALAFLLLAGFGLMKTTAPTAAKQPRHDQSPWLHRLWKQWESDRRLWWTTLSIVLAGAIFRLVGIIDRLHVGDDQARDLLTIKRSVATLHPYIVGPNLSPGGLPVFLGPLYYYLITPAAIISQYRPWGPAVFTALVSIVGLVVLAVFVRRLVSPRAALAALIMMSFSALVVITHRFAWNPNLLPETILVMLIGFDGWAAGRRWGFPLTLGALTLATQLHATAFLLIPALLCAWLLVRPPRPARTPFLIGVLLGVGTYLPLVYHEVKNHWAIFHGYTQIAQSSDVSLTPSGQLSHAWLNLVHFFLNALLTHRSSLLITYGGLVLLLIGCARLRRSAAGILIIAILIWGAIGIWGYTHLLVLHYFVFLITPIVIAIGAGIESLASWNSAGRAAAWLFLGLVIMTNVPGLVKDWRYIGKDHYPVHHSSQIVYRDVEAATAWILADAGQASPELLFIKPTASHNQVAYDLTVELASRVVLERDGILIAAYPNQSDALAQEIKADSSQQPVLAHHDPLYIVVEPAETPLPPAFQLLPIRDAHRFGEVAVLAIARSGQTR